MNHFPYDAIRMLAGATNPTLPPFLDNPVIRQGAERLLTLMQDTHFQDSAMAIAQHPGLKWYGISLLAFFILNGILRYRSMAAIKRWPVRMGVRLLWIPIFYCGIFLISYGFFGENVKVVLLGLWSVVS